MIQIGENQVSLSYQFIGILPESSPIPYATSIHLQNPDQKPLRPPISNRTQYLYHIPDRHMITAMIGQFLTKLAATVRKRVRSPFQQRAVITHIAQSVIVLEILIGMQPSRSPEQHPWPGSLCRTVPALFPRQEAPVHSLFPRIR